ncbi:hypothetical protein [Flavobacterium sp. S87F.05.LMB.W.Kidney.N]|nr:hypothetical protein [Flavobacterium sp. S87F.05.LMB.W.Kidney.N]TDX11210.1 hypothetical protein EDB96_1988 [Flavobacterium sp. S87F.05.LMB.W.Kidney.N]
MNPLLVKGKVKMPKIPDKNSFKNQFHQILMKENQLPKTIT